VNYFGDLQEALSYNYTSIKGIYELTQLDNFPNQGK